MEHQEKKVPGRKGQRGFRDLRDDVRKTCGLPRTPKIDKEIPVFGAKKEPRKLGQPDVTIPVWSERATVQMRGDSNVAEKWKMNTFQWVKNSG